MWDIEPVVNKIIKSQDILLKKGESNIVKKAVYLINLSATFLIIPLILALSALIMAFYSIRQYRKIIGKK